MMSEEQYHSASLCKYLQSVLIHNQSIGSEARPYTYICRSVSVKQVATFFDSFLRKNFKC